MIDKTRGTPVFQKQRLPWPAILFFLFLAVIIAVSSYFFYRKQKKDVFNEEIRQLKTIADMKVAQIENWLADRMADARLIAQNPDRGAILSAFLRDRASQSRRESVQRWLSSLQALYHYENVLLLDRQGEVVLATSPHHTMVVGEGRQAVAAARRLRDVVVSDLHSNPQVPHIHLDLVAPLFAGEENTGFVILRIDPNHFLFPMIQSWPTASPSAETLLVRREGNEVLFLNDLRHRRNTALKLRLPVTSSTLPAARAIQGGKGAFSGRDYRGIAVWSVVQPVEGMSWFMVAKIDRDEIELPLRRNMLAIFLVALSLVLAAAMLILYLWQRQNTRYRLHLLELRQENEEQFRQVFETANVGKSITQLSGEINVNQAFCVMLGYSKDELKKKKWQELTPADEIESSQMMLEPLLKGRQDTARFNKRYICKDGSIVWGNVSVAIHRDPSGKPLHFITTVVDITERKRAEEEIRSAKAFLEMVIDMSPFAMWISDKDGTITKVNHSLCRAINLAEDQIVGKYNVFMDKNLLDQGVMPRVKAVFAKHEPVRFQIQWQAASAGSADFDGARDMHIDVSMFPILDARGELTNVVCQWLDISDWKHAQDEIRTLSTRNQALLEAVPDIIMEVDANKVYTWANHAGTEFFGADVISHEAAFYFEGEQQVYQTVKPIFNGSKDIVYVESWQRRRDGEKRLLAWWCRVLKDAAGNVSGALSSARDITEIKLAENEIHRLNAELEQRVVQRTAQLEAANKELEAFSYSVSHDLRAPLRAISGFTQILLEEYAPKLDKEGRRLLDVITGNTGKMGHLIDDLLAFSRLSRQQMAAAAVDLTVLAKVVFAELHNAEKGRHIEFKVGDLPLARGDHSMLQQVLRNLLANAIKFTRTRKTARIEFGGRAEQTETVYFVKDNGVGFDMAYVKKLFGVFQRLHSADEFEGTGVGLAIVQRIVQRHGGRAWAEGSTSGATFYFSLPTATAPRAAEKGKRAKRENRAADCYFDPFGLQ